MSDHEATATDDSFKNFTHRLKQNKQKQQTHHDCECTESSKIIDNSIKITDSFHNWKHNRNSYIPFKIKSELIISIL